MGEFTSSLIGICCILAVSDFFQVRGSWALPTDESEMLNHTPESAIPEFIYKSLPTADLDKQYEQTFGAKAPLRSEQHITNPGTPTTESVDQPKEGPPTGSEPSATSKVVEDAHPLAGHQTNSALPSTGSDIASEKQPWTGFGSFMQSLSNWNHNNHGEHSPDDDSGCIKSGSSCQTILQVRRCCSGEACAAVSQPLFSIMSTGSLGVCP